MFPIELSERFAQDFADIFRAEGDMSVDRTPKQAAKRRPDGGSVIPGDLLDADTAHTSTKRPGNVWRSASESACTLKYRDS